MQSTVVQGRFSFRLDNTSFLHSSIRWVARLGEWWSRKVDIINRGYSGYNTKWALKIFNEVVLSLKPNFVIIFYGANDAAIESSVQYVPLTVYQQNLITFVQRIQEVCLSSISTLIHDLDPPRHQDPSHYPSPYSRRQTQGSFPSSSSLLSLRITYSNFVEIQF
jgi:lysophospholipase L1-like esterase